MRSGLISIVVFLVLAQAPAPAEGVTRLFSTTDSYGQGLSYPDYPYAPAIAHFVSGDNTSQLASVFLGATLFRPDWGLMNSTNLSYNYSFTWPIYRSYFDGIYTPLTAGDLWDYPWADQDQSYASSAPSVKEFVQPGWRSPPVVDQTPSVKNFMQNDNDDDWSLPERGSGDYSAADKFLRDDDRVPEAPLL
jgi:hypothetical protein